MPKRKKSKTEKISQETTDDAYADTDTEMDVQDNQQSSKPSLFRLSSRLASMKRRGNFVEPKEEYEEFEYLAEDCVTVRAPNKDFYVCRILDDVTPSSKELNVAWFNRTEKNRYEVSYDDVIYKTTIITKVVVKEFPNNRDIYYVTPKSIKETKQLLKETLENEGETYENIIDESEANDKDVDDDKEPVSKKKKKSPQPKKSPKSKQKSGKTVRRGLIPNPDIPLLEVDPKFEKNNAIPLAVERQAIRAVMINDHKDLKRLVSDVQNVHSVFTQRSPHIKRTAYKYALLKNDIKAINLLEAERLNVTAEVRPCDINRKTTGKGNFKMFGHALRDVTVSRGNKEGDNAFLLPEQGHYQTHDDVMEFVLKHNLPMEFIQELMKNDDSLELDDLIKYFYITVQRGYLKLAASIVNIAIKKDGYGFNVLHKEVLNNKTEPLSPFKKASITKKLYLDKSVSPLLCACINPNVKYLQELLNVLPEYNFADFKNNRLVHYAAVCSGDGPLKLLIARGVDPSLPNNLKVTPLMFAAKCNRAHNIKVLMECKVPAHSNEDSSDEGDEEKDEEILQQKVLIDEKDRNSLTALHYAAKKGNLDAVKMLLNYNANINIKASAGKENMTPLGYASAKGHYDVVKYLVENGANPEFKMRRNKNALMYACMNGHSQIVAFLLRTGVNPDARDSSDNTAIHYAAAYGWYNCVQLLLEGGADANVCNNWKTTPLSISLIKHYVEIGNLLLDAGVDVNFVDDHGMTTLMKHIDQKVSKKQLDIVGHLIKKYNADVTKVDLRKWNVLHVLAQRNVYPPNHVDIHPVNKTYKKFSMEQAELCVQICALLLDAGADIDGLDEDGETPLMNAMRRGNYPLVKYMIDRGASVKIGLNKEGEGPIHFIRKSIISKSPSLIDLCEFFKVKQNLKSHELKEKQNLELIRRAQCDQLKLLLDAGADINVIRKDKDSLFTEALMQKDFQLCDVLLNDENINVLMYENRYGENVLHLLARSIQRQEVLGFFKKMLKKFKFTNGFVNHKEHNGLTPLATLLTHLNGYHTTRLNKAHDSAIIEFLTLLVKKCGADLKSVIGKEVRGEKVERASMNITIPVDEKDEERVEKFKDYGQLGLMNILHLAAFIQLPENIFKAFLKLMGSTTASLINEKDRHGRTPLHYDLMKGGYNTKSLLDAGASADAYSDNKQSDLKSPTLVLAIKYLLKTSNGSEMMIEKEKPIDDTNSEPKDEDENSDKEFSEEEIDDEENDDDESNDDEEENDDDENEEDTTVNEEEEDINLPLRERSNQGSLEAIIKKCSSVNVSDLNGMGAAHWIANIQTENEEKMKILEILLHRNMNINACDENGCTMLHYVVMQNDGDYEATNILEQFLLDSGALLDIACNLGRYPLHYAFFNSDNFFSVCLQSFVSTTSREEKFTVTTRCDPMSLMQVLCSEVKEKFGSSRLAEYISHQDKFGYSPLHLGCQRGSTISCMTLKKHGANDTLKNEDGNTPLSLAMKYNHHSTAMMMLQEGASPLCDVITRVSEKEIEEYEKKIEANKYKWNVKFQKPTEVVVSAFSYSLSKCWKDLSYIMLEVSKLPLFNAVKASLEQKKMALTRTLLEKHQKTDISCVDKNNQNLLHILAINIIERTSSSHGESVDYSNYYDESSNKLLKPLQNQYSSLARRFINAGVNLMQVDNAGSMPLHLAASNNFPLARLLLGLAPNLINVKDGMGKTPLVHAMELPNGCKPRKDFIDFLINKGANINVVFNELNESNVVETTTLLHHCVKRLNEPLFKDSLIDSGKPVGCLEYLMENGADVDLTNGKGETALQQAIMSNYHGIVTVLLKYKPKLDHQDKNGNSYIHACVQTLEYGSHESLKMMKTLHKAGAPVNLVNKDKITPLDVAKEQRSGVMAKELSKNIYKAKCSTETMDVDFTLEPGFHFIGEDKAKFDVDHTKDSQAEIEANIEHVVKDDQIQFHIDKHARDNLGKNAELHYDPVTNRPYDATLTKVDVKYGKYGQDSFYKLQVIHQKGKGLWVLFNRWGRFGNHDGQHQQTPFNTAEEAVTEFKKIFRSKTGNEWGRIDSFEKKANKYNLLLREFNPERMKVNQAKVLKEFPKDEELVKSHLDDSLLTFVKDISNVKSVASSSSNRYYTLLEYQPFGLVSVEQIDKAKAVLQQISDVIETIDEYEKKNMDDLFVESTNKTAKEKELAESLEKLARLSNEFYMLVPMSNFDFENKPAIKDQSAVDKLLNHISEVTDVNFACSIMLGAQHRLKEMNPYDYCYSALNCRMESLPFDSHEARLISKFIYNGGDDHSTHAVTAMFRARANDASSYKADLSNKQLLWHGTNVKNIMSILQYGLQITHKNAAYLNGDRFGNGIYFSNNINKSMDYAAQSKSGHCYLFLCEVALGDMFVIKPNKDFWGVEETFPVKKKDSTWVDTDQISDPDENIKTPYGALFAVGKKIDNKTKSHDYRQHEAVVYDSNQVKIRYIIQFKHTSRNSNW